MTTPPADPAGRIDDAGLVRAPRWLVHRRLTDVDAWPRWWPDLRRLRHRADGDRWIHHLEVAVTRPSRPPRWLRLALLPHGHRLDAGMHLVVSGDVVADVEFWLENVAGDTLIHHLAVVHGPDRAATAAWRTLVRRGLWALADRLAAEVRRAVLVDPAGPGHGLAGRRT